MTIVEVHAEGVASTAALAAATRSAAARNDSAVVTVAPHGPTSTRDINLIDTIEDFCHHITEMRFIPDADSVFDRLVAFKFNLHGIVASTEGIPSIVASTVESDRSNRIFTLFVFIQVGQGHHSAFRTVGAVQQNGDINIVEVHILVEAVRPHDDAFALELDRFAARSKGIAALAATTTTRSDVDLDVVAVVLHILRSSEGTDVIRVGVGSVAVSRNQSIRSRSVVEVTGAVTRSILVDTNHQVARAVILERRVKCDGAPAGAEGHSAAKHHVRGRNRLPVGVAGKVSSRNILHEDINLVSLRLIGFTQVEADGIDGTSSTDFSSSVDLLNERIAPQAVVRTIISRAGSITDFHSLARGHVRIDIDGFAPNDGAFGFFTTVAAIDSTNAPLVNAGFEVSPFNVDVDGVGHPNAGQQHGGGLFIRTIIVAVGAIHSVVMQATVFGNALARFADGDVVDIQIEHVGAVEVTNGHITHAAVSAQVDGIFIPVALFATATATLDGLAIRLANALGSHRPLLDGGEAARLGVGRRNGHAEVLSSIHVILGAGIESDDATELHLR